MARNRVLVVDDEKNQREIYTLILEDDGYQVTTAQSGEQALRIAREHPFDLVLTDYKMAGMGSYYNVLVYQKYVYVTYDCVCCR